MKVWLIKEGETLPLNESVRLERTGSLGSYLSAQGHSVVWWASSFNHRTKKYYFHEHTEVDISRNEKVILLHSKKAYQKNVSIARIKYHCALAREFSIYSEKNEKPDIILCSWPTPQFAKAAIRYGKKHHVPVLLDIRDLWPDIYVRAFPKAMEPMAKIMLLPLKIAMGNTIKKASGIVGKEPHALNWGCAYANRKKGPNDACIFIGNERFSISEIDYANYSLWWERLGVNEQTWNICFFSTLSLTSIDLDTAIMAVLKLSETFPQIRLVIGGTGDAEAELKRIANNSPNVVFAGWLNKEQMNSLMKLSKAGLYSMRNTEDFTDSITNKAIQYMSAGLPLINSLTGLTRTLIEEHQIGLTYVEGDVNNCIEIIRSMIEFEEKRQQMGQHSLKVFEEMFESTKINRLFESHLKFVADRFAIAPANNR